MNDDTGDNAQPSSGDLLFVASSWISDLRTVEPPLLEEKAAKFQPLELVVLLFKAGLDRVGFCAPVVAEAERAHRCIGTSFPRMVR